MTDECVRCWSCGYNLTGNVSGRCPECGRTLNRECVPGLKSIYCPACDYDLTRVQTKACPDCGRLFDHDEMLRRANWRIEPGAASKTAVGPFDEPPLVKLGSAADPGGALWPEDLVDSPARLRPLRAGFWPFSVIRDMLVRTSAAGNLTQPSEPRKPAAGDSADRRGA